MKKIRRPIIALILAAMYAAPIVSPVLSFAVHSTMNTLVVLGECSGNCDLCGCPPAKSKDHTCCCARKRAKLAAIHDDHHESPVSSCCATKRPEKEPVLSFTCPCGPKRAAAAAKTETSEVVPSTLSGLSLHTFVDILTRDEPAHPLTCHADPPDPPPKVAKSA